MARVGIVTCANATGNLDCAAAVCLAALRRREGFFARYVPEEPLELTGIVSCAGCPTAAAPQEILRRVRSITELSIDAIHFSYCMTALCPFKEKYAAVIRAAYPGVELVQGTHSPGTPGEGPGEGPESLCAPRATMADLIMGRPVPEEADRPRRVPVAPGVTRETLAAGAKLMVVRFTFAAGAGVPEHRHPHEQSSYIVRGRLRYLIESTERIVIAGEALVIPSGVPHRAQALAETVDINCFTPPREDYR